MRNPSWKLLVPFLALGLMASACGGSDDDDAAATTTAGGGATTTEATTESTFAAGTTMAKIQAAGKIKIGTKFDQPLFGVRNPTNNEIEGFDASIGRLIAEGIFGDDDIDSHIEFIETPSKVRETAITDGQVDLVIATYTINDARKQVVDFAGPYYVAGQDILVKEDDDSITGVDSLNGKKVCSVQGSTSLTNVQTKAPQADLSITFDKYSLCVEALLDGRVEAVTTDNVILLGFVDTYPDEVKLVGKPFTTEPYGIGLKKGDTAFKTWVNERLKTIEDDGSYAEAWDDTAGVTGEPAPTPPPIAA